MNALRAKRQKLSQWPSVVLRDLCEEPCLPAAERMRSLWHRKGPLVCQMRLPCAYTLLHPQHPSLERSQVRCNEIARGLVRQLAVGVELVLRRGDQDLRTVHHQTVEEHEALPQMILRTTGAETARARAHHADRLAIEWLLRRPRRPVDRVLQHTR